MYLSVVVFSKYRQMILVYYYLYIDDFYINEIKITWNNEVW